MNHESQKSRQIYGRPDLFIFRNDHPYLGKSTALYSMARPAPVLMGIFDGSGKILSGRRRNRSAVVQFLLPIGPDAC